MFNPGDTGMVTCGGNVSIAMHCYGDGLIVSPHIVKLFWNVISNERRTKAACAIQGCRSVADLHGYMLRGNSRFLFIFNNDKPGAMIWLNNIHNKTANIHVLGMTSSYGRDMVKLCRMGIGYLFSLCKQTNTFSTSHNYESLYSTFVGRIALSNKLAIRLAIRCGMTVCGTVPLYSMNYVTNKLSDACLLYINNPILCDNSKGE